MATVIANPSKSNFTIMLEMPEIGFARSVDKHNVNRVILVDWVEGSALFGDGEISQSDVIDILQEKGIYSSEDFAAEILSDTWSELRRRSQWMDKGYPFRLGSRTIEKTSDSWEDAPAHAFCLFLTFALYYRTAVTHWVKQNQEDYIGQGHLFERLSEESLSALGWNVHRTGWASGIQTARFQQIVTDVADHLRESFINNPIVALYESANEKGLDIVCHLPFRDERGGKPVYLMQCASGKDWTEKLHTPVISTWQGLINFSSSPQRAFAMPFALEDTEFYRRCKEVDGMLLDRYRLLSASASGADWASVALKTDIIAWLTPRLSALPESTV